MITVASSSIETINKTSDAIRRVFGSGEHASKLLSFCENARTQLTEASVHRECPTRSIAVVGAKNTGKTWMCRCLVKDPVVHKKIPSGQGIHNTTMQPVWIGSEHPKGFNSDDYGFIPVRQDQLYPLGTPYMLLDMPGYNNASISNEHPIAKALDGCQIRILMVSSQTMECQSDLRFVSEQNGTILLPVIIDQQYPSLNNGGQSDIRRLMEKIIDVCPNSVVLDPLIIPSFDSDSGDVGEDYEATHQQILERIAEVLKKPLPDPAVFEDAIIDRMQSRIAIEAKSFLVEIGRFENHLRIKEKEIALKVIDSTLGTEQQLKSCLRMRLRWRTHSDIHDLQFPFRSFMGLLTLTSGAWDKLILSMTGGLPSLAMLSMQALHNLKDSYASKLGSLIDRIKEESSEAMAKHWTMFSNAVRERMPENELHRYPGSKPELDFSGLDVLEGQSRKIFEDSVGAIQKNTRRWVHWIGWGATLLFVAMITGPLYAIYHQFFTAWSGSFLGTSTWQSFPMPPISLILSSMVWILLPVGILAIIANTIPTKPKHIDNCIQRVRDQHDKIARSLWENGTLKVESNSPEIEAIRYLLQITDRFRSKNTSRTIV